MFDFLIAGIQAPWFLLVFTGFTVGIVGGFIGVGGGYMVTPALIVFGFPGYMASGIDMTHIAGKGIVSTVRHRQLGNIDWVLALSMVAGTMFGVEEGIRLLGYFKHLGLSSVALLSASVCLMFTLFVYTLYETVKSHRRLAQMAEEGKALAREVTTSGLPRLFQRFPLAPIVRCRTARVVVSMWVIVLVGVVTGILAGFLGVGGGFIRVPALVYIVGCSTHIAVGTDLVEIVFSGAYGCLRHSIEGNVDFLAVMFMIVGAMFGAQFGSIATAFVRGPAIRYMLSFSLALATLGAGLPLANVLLGGQMRVLQALSVIVTLGQMIFLCLFIISLVLFAWRARRGQWVPDWVVPLLVQDAV
ncbi:MAG: sulfite exporter TauE/SafE family protein [Acidobacteriota bacterium]